MSLQNLKEIILSFLDYDNISYFLITSIKNLIDLDIPIDENGNTLLHLSIQKHNYDLCYKLIKLGCDYKQPNNKKETVLQLLENQLSDNEEDGFEIIESEYEKNHQKEIQKLFNLISGEELEPDNTDPDSNLILYSRLTNWLTDYSEESQKLSDDFYEKYTNVKSRLYNSNNKLTEMTINCYKITEKLNEKEDELEDMEDDLKNLKNYKNQFEIFSEKQYNTLNSINIKLKNKSVELQKKVKYLNSDLVELGKLYEKCQEFNTKLIEQNKIYKEENKCLTEIKDNLEKQLSCHNDVCHEYLKLKESHEFLLGNMNSLKIENDDVFKKLEEAQNDSNQHMLAYHHMLDKYDDIVIQHLKLQDEINGLKSENKQLISQTKDDTELIKKVSKTIMNPYNNLEGSVNFLIEKYKISKNDYNEVIQKYNNLLEKYSRLFQEYQKSELIVKQYRKDIDERNQLINSIYII